MLPLLSPLDVNDAVAFCNSWTAGACPIPKTSINYVFVIFKIGDVAQNLLNFQSKLFLIVILFGLFLILSLIRSRLSEHFAESGEALCEVIEVYFLYALYAVALCVFGGQFFLIVQIMHEFERHNYRIICVYLFLGLCNTVQPLEIAKTTNDITHPPWQTIMGHCCSVFSGVVTFAMHYTQFVTFYNKWFA